MSSNKKWQISSKLSIHKWWHIKRKRKKEHGISVYFFSLSSLYKKKAENWLVIRQETYVFFFFLSTHLSLSSQWHPIPVLLPGKSHGWRSLAGCSPWGRYESDTTERLHFHFSLSCIGEGNGNPLQGSCLETPRDGGAWWAAVYGVAESRTRLKRLSSSSSNHVYTLNPITH